MMYHRACCCNPVNPFFFAVSWTGLVEEWITSPVLAQRRTVDYDTETRIYRIDNGVVTWKSVRPDAAPAHGESIDSGGTFYPTDTGHIDSLDYNAHGLFLRRHVGYNLEPASSPPAIGDFDHAIEKIDVSDGSVTDSITDNYNLGDAPFTVYMCANLEHVFLLSPIYDNGSGDAINWKRLDSDLSLIESGDYEGPLVDSGNPSYTLAQNGAYGFDRPVITPSGDIHHYNLVLDRDDPTTALEHKAGVPPSTGNYFIFRGGVIAIDVASNVVGAEAGKPSVFLYTGTFVDNTGAYRGGSDTVPEASRGPSPTGSELLFIDDATIYAYATYPPDSAHGMVFMWELDVLPLLEAYVDTLARPAIPEGATLRISALCHSGASTNIRISGHLYTTATDGDGQPYLTQFDFFAAEIARGFGESGTASVNWYVDSAYTPPGGVAIDAPVLPAAPVNYGFPAGFNQISVSADAASGIGGSGVDYEYLPTN